jgi:hypothetical protein
MIASADNWILVDQAIFWKPVDRTLIAVILLLPFKAKTKFS